MTSFLKREVLHLAPLLLSQLVESTQTEESYDSCDVEVELIGNRCLNAVCQFLDKFHFIREMSCEETDTSDKSVRANHSRGEDNDQIIVLVRQKGSGKTQENNSEEQQVERISGEEDQIVESDTDKPSTNSSQQHSTELDSFVHDESKEDAHYDSNYEAHDSEEEAFLFFFKSV